MPEQVNDSVQNAWDLPTEAPDRSGAIERLGSDSAPEEDSDKVALAESTSKKATESLAKQSAKIFEFIVEWGVKKYSKVSDKQLDRMEQEGTIDRNFLISQNKTVADLVDEHNDLIDEIIKVDPDQREDLIEALMLLAEKHQVKMSPESNLAMVVVTIIISLAKAGYDHKQQMKKTLRKVSDTYTMQKTALADAERRNAELQARLDNMEKPEQPDEPVKTLSFDMPKKDKPSLSISKDEPVERNREISEAESELEEITSKVDEGNVKPKKKRVVKKVEQ
jgi:hypothetical protein